jgi:hypothetical protein
MVNPNMGMNIVTPRQGSGIANALFPGTKQRVLGLFGQPGRSFYATEVIGLVASGSGAVQRELATLAQSGLVTVKAVGSLRRCLAVRKTPPRDGR